MPKKKNVQRLWIVGSISLAACLGCENLLAADDETDLSALSLEQLMNIEVYSASKFPQKKIDAPAAVTIITAKDIKDYGYRDLAQILRSIRGLYVNYDRNYTYVGSRGFGRPGDYNSRILLLIDGYRVNDSLYDGFYPGNEFILDVDLIDRVEYVPGPGSALYGSNAFFGVVNIITKQGKDIDGLNLSGEVWSYNTDKELATVGKRFDNGLDVAFHASRFDSAGPNPYFRGFDTPETNFGVAHHVDDEDSWRLFGKASYKGFTFQGAVVDRNKGYPNAAYGTIFNDPGTRTNDQQAFFQANYYGTVLPKLDIAANAWHGRYESRGDYIYDYPPRTTNKDGGDSYWWGLELRAVSTHFDDHKLVLGATFQDAYDQRQFNYDQNPRFVYSDATTDGFRYGFYLQDDFSIRPDLTLNAGVRYDYYLWNTKDQLTGATSTFTGDRINPRAALIYKPWETTAFKLLYGTAFRAPSPYETSYTDAFFQARSNLQPETISTYEAVIESQPLRNLRLTASGFYYDIDALIGQTIDPRTGKLTFVNQRANASGAELEGEYHWDNGTRLRTSYTWVLTQDSDTQQWLTNSPKNLVKLNLSVPVWKDWFRLGTEFQYYSSARSDFGKADRFPLLNLTLTTGPVFPKWLKGLEIQGSVYNLLDDDYVNVVDPSIYSPAREDRIGDTGLVPQYGRNFRLKFSYRF